MTHFTPVFLISLQNVLNLDVIVCQNAVTIFCWKMYIHQAHMMIFMTKAYIRQFLSISLYVYVFDKFGMLTDVICGCLTIC